MHDLDLYIALSGLPRADFEANLLATDRTKRVSATIGGSRSTPGFRTRKLRRSSPRRYGVAPICGCLYCLLTRH